MAQSSRSTAAMEFLTWIANLGIASNAEDIMYMYKSVEATTDKPSDTMVQSWADRYNKLYGTNFSTQDMLDYIEQGRKNTFDGAGHVNLPNYGSITDNTNRNGETFDDIIYGDVYSYYSEDANGNPSGGAGSESSRDRLLNSYYRDAYDVYTPGTTANQVYNTEVQNIQNTALESARIADLNAQQAAMQQASTVKSIADQVRNERMARLRAGMSEAQIANQDMQTLMTNINALNQQANEVNAARLSAQSAYNNAQAEAYDAYLQQANAMATAGAAAAAADAGDSVNVANRVGYYSSIDPKFKKNLNTATGTTNTN